MEDFSGIFFQGIAALRTHSQLEEQPAVPVGRLLGDLDGFAQQGLGRVHGILQHKHPRSAQIPNPAIPQPLNSLDNSAETSREGWERGIKRGKE